MKVPVIEKFEKFEKFNNAQKLHPSAQISGKNFSSHFLFSQNVEKFSKSLIGISMTLFQKVEGIISEHLQKLSFKQKFGFRGIHQQSVDFAQICQKWSLKIIELYLENRKCVLIAV